MHYNPHECFLDQSLTLFICSFLSTAALPPPLLPYSPQTIIHIRTIARRCTGHGNPSAESATGSVPCYYIHRLYLLYYYNILYRYIYIYISRYAYCRTPFMVRVYSLVVFILLYALYNIIIAVAVLFLFIFAYILFSVFLDWPTADYTSHPRFNARCIYCSNFFYPIYPCIILRYYDIRARTQTSAKIRSSQLIFIAPRPSPARLTDSSRQIDCTAEDSPTKPREKKWKKLYC